MPDRSGKTEEPTQRRLEKARKEGQFPAAKEFVSALQFSVFLGLLGAGGAGWMRGFRTAAQVLLARAFEGDLSVTELTHIAWNLYWRQGLPLLLAGVAVAVATLAFRLTTTQFGLSWKKLTPDFGRLNPLEKLREMPRQNLPQLVQAMVLAPLFVWAVYAVVREKWNALLLLPLVGVETGYRFITASLMALFWKAAAVFLVFGAVDLFRQRRRHRQDLRMSKQDIKEEMKDIEGNPQMKAQVRRLQRDRARRQMMKEVPKATAVVVNPTHYAVAIRYRMEDMAAPMVVAKGKNYLARRIRELATEHQIPIIENPPLAQALYRSVDVGQEIPPQLYRAVAEILAYIFKLRNGRRA